MELHELKPNLNKNEDSNGIEVFDTVSDDKYSPMFINPLNAKKLSSTSTVHVVIPGILPASNGTWKDYDKEQVFYMPNDFKPHFHGEAQHHKAGKGFEITKVFLLSSETFTNVNNKKLEEYRKHLQDFNEGKSKTAVETWIHWRIPYDSKPYPKLTVKRNSIIWWDFTNEHDLNLVSKNNYENDSVDDDSVLIHSGLEDNLQKGGFYNLDKVQSLSEIGQNNLVKLLLQSMAYSIAMFDYLGFCEFLDKEKATKEKANHFLSKLFNYNAKDGTQARHYRNSLIANKSRYTSYLHKEKVIKDYEQLK